MYSICIRFSKLIRTIFKIKTIRADKPDVALAASRWPFLMYY